MRNRLLKLTTKYMCDNCNRILFQVYNFKIITTAKCLVYYKDFEQSLWHNILLKFTSNVFVLCRLLSGLTLCYFSVFVRQLRSSSQSYQIWRDNSARVNFVGLNDPCKSGQCRARVMCVSPLRSAVSPLVKCVTMSVRRSCC